MKGLEQRHTQLPNAWAEGLGGRGAGGPGGDRLPQPPSFTYAWVGVWVDGYTYGGLQANGCV